MQTVDEAIAWLWTHGWAYSSVRTQQMVDEHVPILLQSSSPRRALIVEPRGKIHFGMIPFQSRSAADAGWNHGPLANDWQVLYGNALDGFRATSMCSGTTVRERIDWLIVHGDTDPLHPDNVRSLRDQAVAAGVKFAFLGWGAWFPRDQWEHVPHLVLPDDCDAYDDSPHTRVLRDDLGRPCPMHLIGAEFSGRLLDGRVWDEMPQTRQEATR